MKNLTEHSEISILGILFYWIKLSLIITPIVAFCYTIYLESLLGNGLWISSEGAGGLGVSIVFTILSFSSSIVSILVIFNIVQSPIMKPVLYIINFISLLFFCITISFFNYDSYYRALKDVTEYCTAKFNKNPAAKEWYEKFNSPNNKYNAINFIRKRTLNAYNALKVLLTVWTGSFVFAIILKAFTNQKLEKTLN